MWWMFDPTNDGYSGVFDDPAPKRGIDISIVGWRIAGRGLLTGDFGHSLQVAPGVPSLQAYGVYMFAFLLICTTSIFVFMFVVLIQRRGRLAVYSQVQQERPSQRFERVRVLG